MRTTSDRIRHALSFEIIGLALVTPAGAWVFNQPFWDIGVLALGSSILATIWTYLYNLGFDHLMLKARGSTAKTLPIRIGHAVAFELGLVIVLVPVVAWYLGVSLWQALVMDISFAAFYAVYAFVFNWAYDGIFPDRTRKAAA